jgi:hypothetical protein
VHWNAAAKARALLKVKTRSIGNRQGWILNESIESIAPGKNFYIAFVDLQGIDAKPDYYLIPKWIANRHKERIEKGSVRGGGSARTRTGNQSIMSRLL